ncbi:MAG TPA: hypothetical protein VL048_01125 [Xanthobacteraceae bacterium]|nr:hypothetical protein [Xanthobacteraceae bacterium]
MRSCIGLIFCSMLFSAMTAHAGKAADQPPDRVFLQDLKKALRTDDRGWLGEHMHYPASYYGPKYIMIKNRAWFDSHYSMLIGSKLRAIVLAQDPDRLFRDRHGTMIGSDLNIRFYNFGTGPEDIRYEIITIDDAE